MISIPDNPGIYKHLRNTLTVYCYPQTEYRHLCQHQANDSLTDYKKSTLSAILVIFTPLIFIPALILIDLQDRSTTTNQ